MNAGIKDIHDYCRLGELDYTCNTKMWYCTMQADDLREKYLLKASTFVTSSRDSWTKKRQRVVHMREKVGQCSVVWIKWLTCVQRLDTDALAMCNSPPTGSVT